MRIEQRILNDSGCSAYVDTNRKYVEIAFKDGAYWGYEEGCKTMIEKARQWFNLHFRQVCTPRKIKHDFESKEKMWKSFIQFMEE